MANGGGGTVRTSQKLATLGRYREALELRKAGVGLAAIAETLGYSSPSSAWRAIRAALKDVLREPAEAVRQLELARLDALLVSCWRKALAGELPAIDRALRIMERRAAYLGLDAPVKIDIEGYIREFARAEGLDEGQAVAEAQSIIRQRAREW